MSGILGVWNLDGRPLEPALLDGMLKPLAHRGPDGLAVWVEGPVGLGAALLRLVPESARESQPFVGSTGVVVVFDGRLDDRADLISRLGRHPGVGPRAPDPELVAAAYAEYGDDCVGHLKGDFALAVFDPTRERLVLARDPVGLRPLHWLRWGRSFMFASEVKAILAHPGVDVRPNERELARSILKASPRVGGHYLPTFFEGVWSVAPGCVMVATPDRQAARRYFDFASVAPLRRASFGEYVEEFQSLFETAIRRRMRSHGPVAVSVSGGLDSSSIFCSALGMQIRGELDVSQTIAGFALVGPTGSPADESLYLDQIEDRYGVELVRLPLTGAGAFAGARDSVWRTEAPRALSGWDNGERLYDSVRESGARTLVTGHWGDQILADPAYLVDLARRGELLRLRSHLKERSRWQADVHQAVLRHMFLRDLVRFGLPPWVLGRGRELRTRLAASGTRGHWFTPEFLKLARDGEREAGAVGHRRASAQRTAILGHVAMVPQQAEANGKVASAYQIELAYPFLDQDLLAFVSAIPGEVVSYHGVPRALLRRSMSGVLPTAIEGRRNKGDGTTLVNEGARSDLDRMIKLFEPGSVAARLGYIDTAVVLRDLGMLSYFTFTDSSASLAWRLGELVGLETWLKVFFDGC